MGDYCSAVLTGLGGFEETVFIDVDGTRIEGAAEADIDRTTAEGKASSVQFIHFAFRPYPVKAGRAPWGCKPWINWRYVMVGRAMARLRTKSPRSSIRRRRLKR